MGMLTFLILIDVLMLGGSPLLHIQAPTYWSILMPSTPSSCPAFWTIRGLDETHHTT